MKIVLVLFIAFAALAANALLHGVNPADASLYKSSSFKCFDGSRTMPPDAINDDYCDCADGSDEPGTSACPTGSFYCINAGHAPMNIPSSRVLDGICDCCDGSDEYNLATHVSACENVCKEAAREARKGLRAQIAKYEAGLRAKDAFMATFLQKLEDEKLRKISTEAEKRGIQDRETVLVAEKDEITARRNAKAESLKPEIIVLVDKELEEKAKADAELAAQPAEPAPEGAEPPPPPPPPPTPEEIEKEREKLIFDKTAAHHEVGAIDEELIRVDEDLILVRDEIKAKDNVIRDIDTFLTTDFGPNFRWGYLHDRTISTKAGEYTYELAAFKEVRQIGSSSHNLGRWRGWDGNVMKYEGGEKCWGGPDRSVHATVLCGGEDKILEVKEPAKCEYMMTIETPAGCTKEEYDRLKAQLAE